MDRLPDSEFRITIERSGIVRVTAEHMPTGVTAWDESASQIDSTTLARGRAEERVAALLLQRPIIQKRGT